MPAKEANEKPQAAPVAEAGKERKKVVAKPDQAAYERDLKEVDNNIETLKKKLAQASDRLNGSDNIRDEFTDRRKQLRDSQDVLTKQRNEIGDKRRKLIDQIKSIQANLRKKNDDTRSSKDRLGYKSVAEVDQQIAALERQQLTGQATLHEEKRIVQEISNLKKARKILDGLGGQQASAEDDKRQLDALRAELDGMNPENEKIRAEIETIKGQLAELDAERKNKMGSVNDLFQDRKSIKAELDAEFDRMRALKAEFRQQKNDFHVYQQEQYARKQEQWKAQKQEEQTYRLNAQAEREREAAEIPAYTDEINLCNALIKFLNSFGTNKSAAVSAPTEGSSGSSPTPTGIRKVEGLPEGAVLMKKKDDEDYLVMGGGKKGGKKGRKQQLSNTDVAPTAKPFKVDFALIDQFGKLKIDLPTSVAGVPKAIEALETKLGWYKENQASATAKAKAAAEAKIAALSRSNSGEDVSSTPAAAGDAKLDESAKDTAPAAKIEA